MAAPSTVAYVMQEKFQNGVPLYRQEAYWKGQGVELRRNTMANWVIRSARWFKPLYDLLRRELLRQDIVNVDETRVHVLKEDGRESKQMSQMWVFCSAEKKIALYQYSPSRSGRAAREMLQALEQAWKDESPQARFDLRQQKLRPLLEQYWALLDSFEAVEGTALSKAKNYSLNQKDALNAVLLDGRLELTNNLAERTVKPFVMARKNFLFCDTAKGADASALCFSVMETAKRNGLNPFGYLLFLLQELPKLGENPTDEQLIPLLPWDDNLPAYCRLKVS